MRIHLPGVALGATLIIGLAASTARAQDQPAAGSPPPAATSEAPAQSSSATPSPSAPEAQSERAARDPQRITQMLAKRLALTPRQQTEIEPIIANRQQQMQSVRADSTLTPRDRRAKAMAILQDGDARIEALLTAAQKPVYAQLKQEMREKRQQHQQQPAASAPGNQ